MKYPSIPKWACQHVKLLRNCLLIIFCVLIVLFAVFFNVLNNNINEANTIVLNKMNSIVSKLESVDYKIKPKKWNESRFALDSTDLENITSHIRLLIAENQKENYRAESIIDKDIDRLTLYMSIGIGFMTLLGIFIPILVNIVTSIDSRSDLEVLINKMDGLNNQTEGIKNDIKKYDGSELKLSHLEVQNSFAKLLNIGTIGVLDFGDEEQKTYIIAQFRKIIVFLKQYPNYAGIPSIMEDFRMMFKFDILNILGIVDARIGFQIADELLNALETYLKEGNENQIKSITIKLEEFVKFLEEQ
jgi:hypothetical protein